MKSSGVSINVRGTDMFGASFSESAKLVSVADCELGIFMWRPVREGARVELNYVDEGYSMRGQIMRINMHLTGAQTVHVKLHRPV